MTPPPRSPATKISVVISDVDGTLLTEQKLLTPRSQAAAAELRARGIAFAIISSRRSRGLSMLLEPLGITTPVGSFNGGVISRSDLTVITRHFLAPDVARRAVALLDAHATQCWVFTGQEWLVRAADGPYVEFEERTVQFGPKIVEDFEPALDAAVKIVGVSQDFALLAQHERDVRSALAGAATVARSQLYYLDVTHPLANKGTALAEMATLMRVPLDEIAAIGDGSNDVAMFARSGMSVAMGNASPEVQADADFVTGSNNDDGFAAAIDRFILGGDRSNVRVETAPAGGQV